MKEKYPFGLEYGLITDLEMIFTNKGDHMEDPYQNIVHGYVWSPDLCYWVIHARYAKDKDKGKNNKEVKKKAGANVSKKPRRRELR